MKAQCAVSKCSNPSHAKGWCRNHYARWRRNGDTEYLGRWPTDRNRTCTVQSCERNLYARGWCRNHYDRWLRNGDTEYRGRWAPHHHETYWAVHSRLRKADPPSSHLCINCGRPAQEWSYCGGDPNQMLGPRNQPYSVDPAYYKPRCRSCHRRQDAARGDKNGSTKFPDVVIDQVRAALERGELQRDIAARFGMSRSNVSLIKLGQTRQTRPEFT